MALQSKSEQVQGEPTAGQLAPVSLPRLLSEMDKSPTPLCMNRGYIFRPSQNKKFDTDPPFLLMTGIVSGIKSFLGN